MDSGDLLWHTPFFIILQRYVQRTRIVSIVVSTNSLTLNLLLLRRKKMALFMVLRHDSNAIPSDLRNTSSNDNSSSCREMSNGAITEIQLTCGMAFDTWRILFIMYRMTRLQKYVLNSNGGAWLG